MAQVLKKAYVTLDTTQISTGISNVAVSIKQEEQDVTCFGRDSRVFGAGLYSWGMEFDLTLNATIDAYLFSLATSGSSGAILVRPTSAAVSTDNPQYSGVIIATDYSPYGGVEVGTPWRGSLSVIGDGDLTRATA